MSQYSSRAQTSKRKRPLNPSLRYKILDRDGNTCGYCGYEATQIDHIVPYSYGGRDDEDNLISCCAICNCIASDRVFDTLDEKRAFIVARYGQYFERRWARVRKQLSMCGDCGFIFIPRVDGATALLCAKCVKIDRYTVSESKQEKRKIIDAINASLGITPADKRRKRRHT